MDQPFLKTKLLTVIPHWEQDSAQQAMALVLALPEHRFEQTVCALGTVKPWEKELREKGIAIGELHSRNGFDLSLVRNLRRIVRAFQPDVSHSWGMTAYRWLSFCRGAGKRVVTPCFSDGDFNSWSRFLDKWLFKRADHVLTWGEREAEVCRRWGIASERSSRIIPGIAVKPLPAPGELPGVPLGHRLILCAGPLTKHHGFQEAIWAFHFLNYIDKDLHLVIVGQGPDQERLQRFARCLKVAEVVHFVEDDSELPRWLARAEMLWSPGRWDLGAPMVLQAMMAGKPVIASSHSRLRDLVVEGETGYLVRPGNVAGISKHAYRLLTDSSLCAAMGQKARERAIGRFDISRLLGLCLRAYGCHAEKAIPQAVA